MSKAPSINFTVCDFVINRYYYAAVLRGCFTGLVCLSLHLFVT